MERASGSSEPYLLLDWNDDERSLFFDDDERKPPSLKPDEPPPCLVVLVRSRIGDGTGMDSAGGGARSALAIGEQRRG